MTQPMEYIKFSLNENKVRPVIMIGRAPAIFDTGAVIPVFFTDEKTMVEGFGGNLTLKDVPLGGIGGEINGSVYRIHDFHLKELNFRTLDVYVPSTPAEEPYMIFSCTMLHGLTYAIDSKRHILGISIQKESDLVRDFTLGLENGRLVTFLNGVQLTSAEQSESDFNYTQYLKKCEVRQHKLIEKVKRFIGELTGGHYR